MQCGDDGVILHAFGIELLLATFRCSAVGLGQWSLFRAGREVMLHVFEMDLLFSTFRCPVVALEQWNYCLHLRWICSFQRLGVPRLGWDSEVIACI